MSFDLLYGLDVYVFEKNEQEIVSSQSTCPDPVVHTRNISVTEIFVVVVLIIVVGIVIAVDGGVLQVKVINLHDDSLRNIHS